MKKISRQIIAFMLAVLVVVSAMPVSAQAAVENTDKEEVIYVNLNVDGTMNNMYAVNIFTMEDSGQILDYGDYDSIRNMTGTEEINQNGSKITIEAQAGKLYYEGKMISKDSPWNVDVTYLLDGKEYTADELAGKSGKLQILMSVTQNTNCDNSFYDGYALQIAFTLNTSLCSNIETTDATIANVGEDKQLTYTILPGKGADISITADVTDFVMDDIAMNGVRMNLDVDVDESELQSKAEEIMDAAKEMNQGASDVKDGSGEIYDATRELSIKTKELAKGTSQISSKTTELYQGLYTISSNNDALNEGAHSAYQGLCDAASSSLNTQLGAYGLGTVSLTPSNYSTTLNQLLKKLNSAYNQMEAGDTKTTLKKGIAEIKSLKEQLDQYGVFYKSLVSYTGAVKKATNGGKKLADSMSTLSAANQKLSETMGNLEIGVKGLWTGSTDLADGTDEFEEKTSGLNNSITDQADSMISNALGKDVETVSFTSSQNTNIESVQFVVKICGVSVPEKDTTTTVGTKEQSFWEKLISLFQF